MHHHIFIISDGTGQTAEQTLRAGLTQYPDAEVVIERFPGVRTQEEVEEIVRMAAEAKGLVLHTVVAREMRRYIRRLGRLRNVDTIDLIGPLLARLSDHFDYSSTEKPGLFRKLNEEYFRRIHTMEFAIDHDDGLRTEELHKAEIVLLGVSRTFKTPLSIYLAFRGWFVGNIPIILDVPLAPNILTLEDPHVFLLTTSPRRLAELRTVRSTYLGKGADYYADFDHVRRELRYARSLVRGRPDWPLVDVTNKPIEEIAAEITTHIRRDSRASGMGPASETWPAT